MGHTIPPKRVMVYEKLARLEKFCKGLRQPYRDRFLNLIHSAYHNVAAMVYSNALDDDELVVYGMLAGLCNADYGVQERVKRCVSILLSEELP